MIIFKINYICQMKFFSRIILLFFIFFQFSPSVFVLVNSDKGNKITMNILDEDENSKEIEKNKELKLEYIYTCTNEFLFLTKEIFSKVYKPYLLKEYSTFSTQFIPPPELV